MKEASFYRRLEDKNVVCELCPNNCFIPEGFTGWCGVRHNKKGKLYSLNYEKPVAIAIDPVEKKPLKFFHSGEKILSIGTYGCNLHCKNCQNFGISQAEYFKDKIKYTKTVSAKEIIKRTKEAGLKLIAFTYNEPTIFYEYMIEIAKLAKKAKIKTVLVSNGMIAEEPLKELLPYLDAANIDVKSFKNSFYKEVSSSLAIAPILTLKNTLKTLFEAGVHLELTHLVIPDYSSKQEVDEICKWVKNELSSEVPIHLSRFFPYYKMNNKPATDIKFLKELEKTAKKHLKKVIMGNV